MTYRQKGGEQVWHFCANCEEWPVDHYVEVITNQSPAGELCHICKEQEQNNQCRHD